MLIIRRAASSDATHIISFQKAMALETEDLELNSEILSRGVNAVFSDKSRGCYWVAEDEGQIVASLLITYEWSDWRNSNVWWFQSVYVIPEYRRKGVFRSMYQTITTEAEKEGVAGLRLYVETNNHRARSTYEALGMSNQHYAMYELLRN